jgi:hypothetical protein
MGYQDVTEKGDFMQLLLLYPTGRRVEGVVLSASRHRMRVAVRDRNETIELRLADGQWLADDGDPVEFDAITADGANDRIVELCSAIAPRVRTAGEQPL